MCTWPTKVELKPCNSFCRMMLWYVFLAFLYKYTMPYCMYAVMQIAWNSSSAGVSGWQPNRNLLFVWPLSKTKETWICAVGVPTFGQTLGCPGERQNLGMFGSDWTFLGQTWGHQLFVKRFPGSSSHEFQWVMVNRLNQGLQPIGFQGKDLWKPLWIKMI